MVPRLPRDASTSTLSDIPVFQTLATLAWEPRRAGLFWAQLFAALTMVDRGHIDAPSMKGSWAGAMGQPQFMPSSARWIVAPWMVSSH